MRSPSWSCGFLSQPLENKKEKNETTKARTTSCSQAVTGRATVGSYNDVQLATRALIKTTLYNVRTAFLLKVKRKPRTHGMRESVSNSLSIHLNIRSKCTFLRSRKMSSVLSCLREMGVLLIRESAPIYRARQGDACAYITRPHACIVRSRIRCVALTLNFRNVFSVYIEVKMS